MPSFYKTIFILFILLNNFSVFGQYSYSQIDFSRISDKHIAKALSQELDLFEITKVKTLCYDSLINTDFRTHTKSYLIEMSPDKVFHAYKTANPAHIWKGKILNFGFLYSTIDHKISYPDDPYYSAKEGQIIFNHLRLIGGIRNLVVGYEVTKVDEQAKILQFCYIEGGTTRGTQTIHFKATTDGGTHIEHHTRYKSKSKFRDKILYPKFHTLSIDEFHQNLKKYLEKLKED